MIFSSIQFLIFFCILLFLLIILKNKKLIKICSLLGASIFFYAYWDIRFVPLLLVIAFANYIIGSIIDTKSFKNNVRKYALFIGIIINVGILVYFKYMNFFIENTNMIFYGFGINLSTLNIVLPLGISFFIFEFISYLIDVYTHKIEHTKNLMIFLTFVFFFPRLASGPIIRPTDFLQQLDKEIVIRKSNIMKGIQIFTLGLFKKLVIADRLAICTDTVFASPNIFDSTTIWIGVIAYTIQIYCDFSGYSDMAIGLAKIMGFELPINFNMPYLSLNVSEFWRRWHISLSTWLGDYLYIPLGGNRKGIFRKNINLIITMLIGGLWHGANWTFVVWGGIHGIALVIQKIFSDWHKRKNIQMNRYFSILSSWLTTFIFINVSWVFFRASTFNDAILIIKKMFIVSNGINWIYTPLLYLIIPIVIGATFIKYLSKKKNYLILNISKPLELFILIFSIMGILFLSANNSSPFIYFQF